MSKTPICDFVKEYAEKNALRLHMPGHKGKSFLGCEMGDITEFDGADSLYEASSIIARSEQNAGKLFGSHCFYSTEGSSQCIRAMLYLARLYALENKKPMHIAAGRNAHKVFLSAAAMLDWEISWLAAPNGSSCLSCPLEPTYLDTFLQTNPVAAVYITSPDYLGNLLDISAIAEVAHRHKCLLLVDNAHGAYLKFLSPSRHPMDLGADLCCDSAHKTLPALTGAAYLHIFANAPAYFQENAKNALALFGSTSPSYLILQSLDRVNAYLAAQYSGKLHAFISQLDIIRQKLSENGYVLQGDEPLKITLNAKAYGYTGHELAEILGKKKVFCEFHDPDFLVMMFTPEHTSYDLETITQVLLAIPRRPALPTMPPVYKIPQAAMTVRQAILSPAEKLPAAQCAGRILAYASVGCPPAVPIAVPGERLDEHTLALFAYYGYSTLWVTKE